MSGTVIDAETGKQIEGAVVLVEWTKTKGFGLTRTESYKVVEVLTDKDGKFKVSGVIDPFVDPHLTIYKKGYVAWNNDFTFPDYKKRINFKWGGTQLIRMEKFKETYSHKQHVSFIRDCINNELAYNEKAKFREAFSWEIDLAIKE